MSLELIQAVINNNLSQVEALINKRDDVNFHHRVFGDLNTKNTPLFYAIQNMNLEMIRYLIAHGANIEVCQKNEEDTTTALDEFFELLQSNIRSVSHINSLVPIMDLLFASGALLTSSSISHMRMCLIMADDTSTIKLFANLFFSELIIRGNLSHFNDYLKASESGFKPTPEEFAQYLKIAARPINELQLKAIHNTLNMLVMNKQLSEEVASEYEKIISNNHQYYAANKKQFYSYTNDLPSLNLISEKNVLSDKIIHPLNNEISLHDEINELKTNMQLQSQKIDALTQQNQKIETLLVELIKSQKNSSRNNSMDEDKNVISYSIFKK